MAKLVNGSLFKFTGRLGGVYGRIGRDGSCIISKLPCKRKKGPSLIQVVQQERFRLAYSVVKSLKRLVHTTFKDKRRMRTGYNSAMSYILLHAIAGNYPNFYIDWVNLRVSQGALMNPWGVKAILHDGMLCASWDFRSEPYLRAAHANDRSLIVVYSPDLDHSFYSLPGTREDGIATIGVNRLKGHTIHAYLAFITENSGESSNSIYLGKFTIE